jgi:very-short-patch-repair endonuclease
VDVAAAFALCSADQHGLATRAQLAAAGLGRGRLQDALAAGDLVRIGRSVYAQVQLPPWPAHLLSGGVADPAFLRRAQACLLRLGPAAALRARCAAVAWGLDMLVEPDQLEVQVPRTQSRVDVPGVDARRTSAAVQVVSGLRVVSLDETLRECALSRPTTEAVAIVDSALRRGLTWPRRAGRGALARAIQLADPRSGSVLESALRVLLAEAGLPAPESQYVVRNGRNFVARVDFCWPACRLIVEADGRRWHDPLDARAFDRRRANDCAKLGWRLLRFTWAEVLHSPAYVIETVRQALAH